MLQKKTTKGLKGPGDRVLRINTTTSPGGWHAITYTELLGIIADLFENEDRLYPIEGGYKGRGKLMERITFLYDHGDTMRTGG